MDQPYLRIRFPRPRPCGATLSVPGGVARAIRRGGLPGDAEALVPEIESWVPVAQHPAVALLSSAMSWEPEAPNSSEPDEDPAEVVLLDPDQLTVLASARDQERRIAARSSEVRISQPAKVIVAGAAPEAEGDPGASLWRRQLLAVQRWAAAL